MTPELSILISSHNRLPLIKRAFWSIEERPPSVPFEVIVADEESSQDILGALREFSFPWKFIRVEMENFTKVTGLKKFWNNPSLTHNVAFAHCSGRLLAQMGNEIIVWGDAFDKLLADLPDTQYAWSVSTTYDLPQSLLDRLDEYGTNLAEREVKGCSSRLLSNSNNVPNYLSVMTRECWEATHGYDERYLGGIGAEDADFMRRVMSLPQFRFSRSAALSLHQYHGGVSHLYRPLPHVITEQRLAEGVAINQKIYKNWDGLATSGQFWEAGRLGVVEVITR